MPTATSTLTRTAYPTQVRLKGAIPQRKATPLSPIPSPTTATLRTLYNRAARAFLLRDIPLTHSLIESAFALIHPPNVVPDTLLDQRRKWDILRITLESTVYSSPPIAGDMLPQSLQESLVESPQALLTSIYTRSIALFTPDSGVSQKSKANAAYLPPQVLTTLVYSSLRIDCPDVGRVMIEDWLSRREIPIGESRDEGYEKILELYCLHILPKLDQWDYAQEFLEYEGELLADVREVQFLRLDFQVQANFCFRVLESLSRPFTQKLCHLIIHANRFPHLHQYHILHLHHEHIHLLHLHHLHHPHSPRLLHTLSCRLGPTIPLLP